jgi:ring-1,2-phenylacetyl-CoA epoxidase subunit PaaD
VSASVATEAARELAGRVIDPEIPVLTIEDLGILRDVVVDDDGNVEVTVTPTYSGCPAMDVIRDDVTRTLAEHGYGEVRVRTVLAPAWTTDWMSAEGRAKLTAYGIAPPGRPGRAGPVPVRLTTRPREPVACPRCGSDDTREISRFGSTACKSHHACRACLEPFDHFKPL